MVTEQSASSAETEITVPPNLSDATDHQEVDPFLKLDGEAVGMHHHKHRLQALITGAERSVLPIKVEIAEPTHLSNIDHQEGHLFLKTKPEAADIHPNEQLTALTMVARRSPSPTEIKITEPPRLSDITDHEEDRTFLEPKEEAADIHVEAEQIASPTEIENTGAPSLLDTTNYEVENRPPLEVKSEATDIHHKDQLHALETVAAVISTPTDVMGDAPLRLPDTNNHRDLPHKSERDEAGLHNEHERQVLEAVTSLPTNIAGKEPPPYLSNSTDYHKLNLLFVDSKAEVTGIHDEDRLQTQFMVADQRASLTKVETIEPPRLPDTTDYNTEDLSSIDSKAKKADTRHEDQLQAQIMESLHPPNTTDYHQKEDYPNPAREVADDTCLKDQLQALGTVPAVIPSQTDIVGTEPPCLPDTTNHQEDDFPSCEFNGEPVDSFHQNQLQAPETIVAVIFSPTDVVSTEHPCLSDTPDYYKEGLLSVESKGEVAVTHDEDQVQALQTVTTVISPSTGIVGTESLHPLDTADPQDGDHTSIEPEGGMDDIHHEYQSSSQTDFVGAKPLHLLDITEHAEGKKPFLEPGEEVVGIHHKNQLEARIIEDWRASPIDVENTEPPRLSNTHGYDTENLLSVDTTAEMVGIRHEDHLDTLEKVAVVTTQAEAPHLLDSTVHSEEDLSFNDSKTKSSDIRDEDVLQAVGRVADQSTFTIDVVATLPVMDPRLPDTADHRAEGLSSHEFKAEASESISERRLLGVEDVEKTVSTITTQRTAAQLQPLDPGDVHREGAEEASDAPAQLNDEGGSIVRIDTNQSYEQRLHDVVSTGSQSNGSADVVQLPEDHSVSADPRYPSSVGKDDMAETTRGRESDFKTPFDLMRAVARSAFGALQTASRDVSVQGSTGTSPKQVTQLPTVEKSFISPLEDGHQSSTDARFSTNSVSNTPSSDLPHSETLIKEGDGNSLATVEPSTSSLRPSQPVATVDPIDLSASIEQAMSQNLDYTTEPENINASPLLEQGGFNCEYHCSTPCIQLTKTLSVLNNPPNVYSNAHLTGKEATSSEGLTTLPMRLGSAKCDGVDGDGHQLISIMPILAGSNETVSIATGKPEDPIGQGSVDHGVARKGSLSIPMVTHPLSSEWPGEGVADTRRDGEALKDTATMTGSTSSRNGGIGDQQFFRDHSRESYFRDPSSSPAASEPHHDIIHTQRPFRDDSLNSNPAKQSSPFPAPEPHNGSAGDQQSIRNISLTSTFAN